MVTSKGGVNVALFSMGKIMRRCRNIQSRFAIAAYRGPFVEEYARDDVEGMTLNEIFDRLKFIRFQSSQEFSNDILKAVA